AVHLAFTQIVERAPYVAGQASLGANTRSSLIDVGRIDPGDEPAVDEILAEVACTVLILMEVLGDIRQVASVAPHHPGDKLAERTGELQHVGHASAPSLLATTNAETL